MRKKIKKTEIELFIENYQKLTKTVINNYNNMSDEDHRKYTSSLDWEYIDKKMLGKVYSDELILKYIKESHDKYYRPLIEKLPYIDLYSIRDLCNIIKKPEICDIIINSNKKYNDIFPENEKISYKNIYEKSYEFGITDPEIIKKLYSFKPNSRDCINIGVGEIWHCLFFTDIKKNIWKKNGDLINIKTGEYIEVKGKNGKLSPYNIFKFLVGFLLYKNIFNKSNFDIRKNTKKNGETYKNDSLYIDGYKITDTEERYNAFQSIYYKNCKSNFDFIGKFVFGVCYQYKICEKEIFEENTIDVQNLINKISNSFYNIKCFDEKTGLLIKESFDRFHIAVSAIATCIKEKQDYLILSNEETGDIISIHFKLNDLNTEFINQLYEILKHVKITGYPSIDERCDAVKVTVNVQKSVDEK